MNESIICKRNIETFGIESAKNIAIEECAELITALSHEHRGRVSADAVITEIADVQIICEQLMQIYGRDKVTAERYRKLRRQDARIRRFVRNNSFEESQLFK